jgi:hypothetical protein
MSYPRKLKERARQLASEELSAEAIVDIFSKEADRKELVVVATVAAVTHIFGNLAFGFGADIFCIIY